MVYVTIRGQITIDDNAAEMLELLTSYDLAEFFAEKCSKKYKADEIQKPLQKLRQELHTILAARKKAIDAINERPKDSPPCP